MSAQPENIHLFSPLTIREVTFRNRIAVAPMCQYSSEDGFANDWHLVHLGARAVGGAGLVILEASGVEARGRISPQDLGIYKDEHIEPLRRVTRFLQEHGSVAGIQIAHAGRKASTYRPWEKAPQALVPETEGGWQPVAPSPIAFEEGYGVPTELSEAEIGEIVRAFGQAARRSLEAGFELVEIHAAHGYLLNEFLSPLSNQRTDKYGGSFENRTRIVREVTEEVRRHWPERLPLFIRFSVTDWAEGGWDPEQTVELSRQLKSLGVDLVDASSGGNVAKARIPIGPGYQTPFAEKVRREAGIATGAVGLITSPHQADHIIRTGQADLVLLARELLRDPYWPSRAAQALGQEVPAPVQYVRAW
jgi:2,4-dienoyl-CoA reductase-like NADH-dependent reductase (Old Yellow Enzyme family)